MKLTAIVRPSCSIGGVRVLLLLQTLMVMTVIVNQGQQWMPCAPLAPLDHSFVRWEDRRNEEQAGRKLPPLGREPGPLLCNPITPATAHVLSFVGWVFVMTVGGFGLCLVFLGDLPPRERRWYETHRH